MLSSGKWISFLTHLNKCQKLFLLVRSKMLYIHQFSLISSSTSFIGTWISHKRLGLIIPYKVITSKVNKTTWLMRELNNCLARYSRTTFYKSFIRPHLDYVDVIFDKADNNFFQQILQSLLYKASLAITGVVEVLLRRSFIKC